MLDGMRRVVALVWLAACSGRITGSDPAVVSDDGGVAPGDVVDAAPPPTWERPDGGTPPPDPPVPPDAMAPPDAEPPPAPPDPPDPPPDSLEWRTANLTYFTSYPEPGSEECEDFSGCEWAGYFAFVDGQQSEEWVMSHNIAAVHSDDGDEYALKTLRLRDGDREIDVVVYDVCSDSDCSGCCSRNREDTGFLIDIESYTAERFGAWHGIVEWACLDCD